ncbi:MAG: C45 family autoproteolytic acyltransferase/hydrolase [Acidobacteria bacterium]|nr:C45 family autoproteolytic acyltransferase/hydrolase [Acidobacteriota bacterium]
MEKTFPVVSVSGTSFEMGWQHGRQAAPLIEKYLCWIEKLTGKPRKVLAEGALRFEALLRGLSGEYMDEVTGLAEGAGIPFGEAMLCQVRAEAARMVDGACTAFALRGTATRDGRPLAGQNQDVEAEYAEVAIVLKVKPSGGRPRAVMLTWAGQLGYAGMNEHGVAQFANSLYNFAWWEGVPHYPMKRLMLEQRSVAGCLALLRAHRLCSAGNIVLCDGSGEIADVEVRPEGGAVYEDLHPDARLHTNHYLTGEFAKYEDGFLPDSCPRLDRVRQLVKAHWGEWTVDRLKGLLADHEGSPAGICRHGAAGIESACGYIADPVSGVFHVRRGLGCSGVWEAYAV